MRLSSNESSGKKLGIEAILGISLVNAEMAIQIMAGLVPVRKCRHKRNIKVVADEMNESDEELKRNRLVIAKNLSAQKGGSDKGRVIAKNLSAQKGGSDKGRV
ncbi:hypothetical protein Tco_0471145 [Tanacetum coccineum]